MHENFSLRSIRCLQVNDQRSTFIMSDSYVFIEKYTSGKSNYQSPCLVIPNDFVTETNEFTIPKSEVVVKLRRANNMHVEDYEPIQFVLVQPANDIILLQDCSVFGGYPGILRSKEKSFIFARATSPLKLLHKEVQALSLSVEVRDCVWKKSFLNLIPDKPTDVVLRADGKDIATTIDILSAKSDAFAAMFTHDTKEKQTCVVEIADFSFEVVQEMIRFMMNDYCTLWDGCYDKLLAIADNYNIAGMKKLAAEKKILLDRFT